MLGSHSFGLQISCFIRRPFFPVFGLKRSRLRRKGEVSTWGSHAPVYNYTCGLLDNVRPILVNHSVVHVVTWVLFLCVFYQNSFGEFHPLPVKPNLILKAGDIRRNCDWIKKSQPSQHNNILALCVSVKHGYVKVTISAMLRSDYMALNRLSRWDRRGWTQSSTQQADQWQNLISTENIRNK